jgi:aminoglycoside/choline kinase family phosphotransferase
MTGSPALGERERAAILRAAGSRWPRAGVAAVEPLAGDASMRRYARVRLAGDGAPPTCMAMLLPEGEAAARSEEPTNDEALPTELPFVDVQRLLARGGVPVPEIFQDDTVGGVLLLEDLGDRSLAAAALDEIARDREPTALFVDAVEVLAAIATVADRPGSDSIAFRRRFDRALIASELRVASDYGLARGDEPRDGAADRELERALARLGDDLAGQHEVLMHRDYHAWNLHVDAAGRVRVIDFQDAMLGPALHDLASLCTDRDSDRFVRPALEAELVEKFGEALARRGGPRLERDRLARDYFTAAAFRTLRVIGRFRFLAIERGNPRYLHYLPRMARQTRRALEGRGDGELLSLLAARSELFA